MDSSSPEQQPDQQPPSQPPQRPPRPGQEPSGDEEAPRSSSGGVLLLVIILLLVVLTLFYFKDPANKGTRVSYSFFRSQLAAPQDVEASGNDESNIAKVKFHGQVITGTWKEWEDREDDQGDALEEQFNTMMPSVEDRELIADLRRQGVEIQANKTNVGAGTQLIFWLIGPLMIIGFFYLMMRRSSDPMGGGMLGNFVKSPAKRFRTTEQRTTFEDVAGMEQPKKELMEIVEFLRSPEKFHRLGATIPKGVLLMGPPGNGKTLLARATAGEAGVPFYSINGSEFIQMFVGVGASRVRDLFRTAKENAPSIMFIDEIDAVGRVRGAGVGGGHDEREQTLNQILSEMDGFLQTEAVIVIAATNRPDVLDPALLRPGRFDRHIAVERPSKQGREGILKVHCRKVPLSDDVNMEEIAAGTIGFSGADLKNLVNEAALIASREDQSKVTAANFDAARDRVIMGPVREEILSEYEKQMTAYHEAGHALMAWMLPEVDPVYKVTIIPRGRALGVMMTRPDEERYSIGEQRLHSEITVAMAGRAAEKLVFNEYTVGAENDLKQATSLARKMVGRWGMSEVIGPVAFNQGEEHPFLGKEMHEQREFSEETAREIDQEVQRILLQAAEQATTILKQHRQTLDKMTSDLLEKETLNREELTDLLGERLKPNTVTLPFATESKSATETTEEINRDDEESAGDSKPQAET